VRDRRPRAPRPPPYCSWLHNATSITKHTTVNFDIKQLPYRVITMRSVHPTTAEGGVEVVLHKLVQPSAVSTSAGSQPSPATELSACDAYALGRSNACSWGFAGSRFDAGILEAALQACLDDLPMLAGR